MAQQVVHPRVIVVIVIVVVMCVLERERVVFVVEIVVRVVMLTMVSMVPIVMSMQGVSWHPFAMFVVVFGAMMRIGIYAMVETLAVLLTC